jgi:tyrosyl-tRNA synthetase
VKFELGVEIVDRFHGAGAGATARDGFIAQFRDGAVPADVPELDIAIEADGAKLAAVLKEAQLVASTSAAYRLIEQRAVRLDGERVADRDLVVKPGARHLLQVGKRGFARVVLRPKG